VLQKKGERKKKGILKRTDTGATKVSEVSTRLRGSEHDSIPNYTEPGQKLVLAKMQVFLYYPTVIRQASSIFRQDFCNFVPLVEISPLSPYSKTIPHSTCHLIS
jgi:hypothetical protein